MLETLPLWRDLLAEENQYPELTGEHKADAVVIGGGFTGVSASYHLQEQGVDTIVLEKEYVGRGASGRNGGMLNTGLKLSPRQTIDMFGVEQAAWLDRYALDSIKLVKKLVEENNIKCDLFQSGHMMVCQNNKEIGNLRKTQDLIGQKFGRKVRVVCNGEIARELDSNYFSCGLLDELSFQFNPQKYVSGLAKSAHAKGTKIYENTEARKVEKRPDGFLVDTNKGIVRAKKLIYATDGYSNKIVDELHKGILPIASYIIATEEIDADLLRALMPNRRNFYDNKNLTNYFRATPDNRIIFGGSGIRYPAKPEYKSELYKLLTNVFPQLKGIKIEYFWGGLIGAAVEKFPVIGRTGDGALYSVGYTGHGAAQSTMHGKILSKIVTDDMHQPTVFEQRPLKNLPMHQHKRFLLNAADLYFRMLDKFT